jgi:hypothetical protein
LGVPLKRKTGILPVMADGPLARRYANRRDARLPEQPGRLSSNLTKGEKMAVTVAEMLKMSQGQLDDLFTQSPVGEIPSGEAKGTAIVAPGTTYTQDIANFINHFAWQGKVFDPAKGVLRNKILPFGLNAIIAKVYKGPSWLDKKECIVLDYSETSLLAHWIRDEIREVAPHSYLGKVYLGKKRLIDFALEFPASG